MRPILAGLCVLTIGCSGQTLNSPSSPTPASATTTSLTGVVTAVHSGHDLPFRGSLAATETDTEAFPSLLVDGKAEGTATHLGRYAAAFKATVNLFDGSATGSYTFTAANGDQLFSTFTGLGVPAGDGLASITETLTITGGSGRFAGAGGTVVVERMLNQSSGKSFGSIEGSIVMQQ